MDEKQLQLLWNLHAKDGGFSSYGEFKGLMDNPNSRKVYFDNANSTLGFKNYGEFESTLGTSRNPTLQPTGFFGEVKKGVQNVIENVTKVQPTPKYGSVPIPVKTAPPRPPQVNNFQKSIDIGLKPLSTDAPIVTSATTETKPTVQQANQLIAQNKNALEQSQKIPVAKRDKHGLIVDVPILDPAIQAQKDLEKKINSLIDGMDYDELSKVNSDGGQVGTIKDKVEKAATNIGGKIPLTKGFDSYLKEGLFQMHKANSEGYDKQVENIVGADKVRGISELMKFDPMRGIGKEDQKQIDADFEGSFAHPIQIGINIAANKVSTQINALKDKGYDKTYEQYSELMNKANSISDVLKTFQGQIDKAQLPPEEQKKFDALNQQYKQLSQQLAPLQSQYQQIVQQVEAIKANPQLDDLTKQTQINQIVGKYRPVIEQYEAGIGKLNELQKTINPYIEKQKARLQAANPNEIDIFGAYNKNLGELNAILADANKLPQDQIKAWGDAMGQANQVFKAQTKLSNAAPNLVQVQKEYEAKQKEFENYPFLAQLGVTLKDATFAAIKGTVDNLIFQPMFSIAKMADNNEHFNTYEAIIKAADNNVKHTMSGMLPTTDIQSRDDKGNYNYWSIGQNIGTMVGYCVATGVSGGMTTARGLTMNYLMTKNAYYDEALGMGLKKSEAGVYSSQASLFNTLLQLVNPDMALERIFNKQTAKFWVDAARSGKAPWETIKKMGISTAGETIQEELELLSDKMAQAAHNMHPTFNGSEFAETAGLTTTFTLLTGGVHGVMQAKKFKDNPEYLTYAAQKFDAFKNEADAQLTKGVISRDDYATLMKTVTEGKALYDSMPESVRNSNALMPVMNLLDKRKEQEFIVNDETKSDVFKKEAKDKIKILDEQILAVSNKAQSEEPSKESTPTEAVSSKTLPTETAPDVSFDIIPTTVNTKEEGQKTQERISELEAQRDKEIANLKILFTDNPSEEVKVQRIKARKQEIANEYNSQIEAIKQKATERATKGVESTAKALENDRNRNEKDFANENESYRVIVGDEAFNDILESGVVRVGTPQSKKDKQAEVDKVGGINLDRSGTTAFPSFSKGSASMSYAKGNPNNYIIVTEDASIQPSTSGRHGKGSTMFPTDANGKHLKELDGSKVKVYKHIGEGKYELVYANGKAVESLLSKEQTPEAKATASKDTESKKAEIKRLRKQEQADYAAMSNPNDKAARQKIYDAYDKLITPLINEVKADIEKRRKEDIDERDNVLFENNKFYQSIKNENKDSEGHKEAESRLQKWKDKYGTEADINAKYDRELETLKQNNNKNEKFKTQNGKQEGGKNGNENDSKNVQNDGKEGGQNVDLTKDAAKTNGQKEVISETGKGGVKTPEPKNGDKVELPPQIKGGMPRIMEYRDGKWQQKVGNEYTNVSDKVQQQSQEQFNNNNFKQKNTVADQVHDELLDFLGIAEVTPTEEGKSDPFTPNKGNISNKSELSKLEENSKSDKNKKAIIAAAKKAIATLKSVFPKMEIFIHDNVDDYNKAMAEFNGEKNSKGNFAFERDEFGNHTGKGRIDINLSAASATTIAHEVTHAILLKAFGDSPKIFKQFRDQISKILRADLNKELLDFEKMYEGQEVAPEEYLTQLSALLSKNNEAVNYKPSTLKKIAALINDFVSKITKGKFQPFKGSADFKNFVDFLNQISSAIREGGAIKNLNNQEAYSTGESIPISNHESFVAKKVESKSQIGDYKIPDNIEILKTANLPIKNLTDLVRQYKGKVVIITSDATGYGVDKNGDAIFGGFGFSANAKNVSDGIGFASVSIGTVKGTYTAAEKAYGVGKVLTLIMIQPPHTTINNSYGAKYIIKGIKEVASQSKNELAKTKEAIKNFIKNSTAIQNELKNNETSVKRGSERKLIELIDSIDKNTDLDSAVQKFIADTTFTIRKELGKGIILENKDIKTNKSTNYAKIALNNAGYNIFHFLKEYGDNTFLTDDIILNNTGGFVVGGFELDILPTEQREKSINDLQGKGIAHPLFNAKLAGSNHFRLDGLYDVQENFSEYVRPETIITLEQKERDKLVRKYYKEDKFYNAQYRSIPLNKRIYTQLTIPAKTEFKEKYLRKIGGLAETIPNIATKVAKGEGFIPKPNAAKQMTNATYASKSQVDAFHGSPHSFDKFLMDKIGTGEGVQAFGYGLYFSDLKSIGESYAKNLILNKKYSFEGIGNIDNIALHPMTMPFLMRMLKSNPQSRIGAINWVRENSKGKSEKVISELMGFANLLNIDNSVKGNVYNVTLHEGKSPSEYTWLEWDKKPNKQQVNDLLSKLTQEQLDKGFYYGIKPDATNADLYKGLSKALGSDKQASIFLLENGIDGIKYPAESIARGATSENARGSNYVVFDENAVTIKSKSQKKQLKDFIESQRQKGVSDEDIRAGLEKAADKIGISKNNIAQLLGKSNVSASENKTVKEGDKTELPAQIQGGQKRIVEFKDGEWQQKWGSRFIKLNPKLQNDAHASFLVDNSTPQEIDASFQAAHETDLKDINPIIEEVSEDSVSLQDKSQNNGQGTRNETDEKTPTEVGNNGRTVIENRGRTKSDTDTARAKAKEKLKSEKTNIALQAINKYLKALGKVFAPHSIKKSDKEVQTKIANVFKTLKGVTSKNYQETAAERRIFDEYKKAYPAMIAEHGIKNYKDLVIKAYKQLEKEVDAQFASIPVKVDLHRGEKNYENSAEMLDDVHNHNHLWVYVGGDNHPLFGDSTKDKNGLTTNDKFRAVHDFYGHSISGYEFGKNGEENAWIEHSKTFSKLAQLALSTETRGQNSFVNYSGANDVANEKIKLGAALKKQGQVEGNQDKINAGQKLLDEANSEYNYAEQKAVILPEKFTNFEQYVNPIEGETENDLEGTKIERDGKPIVVYRSQKDNKKQGAERQSNHFGIYFSENNESTKIYGDNTQEYYLNIKNPLILKDTAWNLSVLPKYLYDKMIKDGYDGAVWLRKGEMYEVIAFNEDQVIKKSDYDKVQTENDKADVSGNETVTRNKADESTKSEPSAKENVSEKDAVGNDSKESVESTAKALEEKLKERKSSIGVKLRRLAGLITHGGESVISKFDFSKIKGGVRGRYGKGIYFSSLFKNYDYGGKSTFLKSSGLKLMNGDITVSEALNEFKLPSDIKTKIAKLEQLLAKVKNNKDYNEISKEIEDLKNQQSKFDENTSYIQKALEKSAERNPNLQFSSFLESLESEVIESNNLNSSRAVKGLEESFNNFLLQSGFDGVNIGDGQEILIIPQEKINDLLVSSQEKFIAEEYNKAKEDNSNPELVKAVESLLSKEQAEPIEKKVGDIFQNAKIDTKNTLNFFGLVPAAWNHFMDELTVLANDLGDVAKAIKQFFANNPNFIKDNPNFDKKGFEDWAENPYELKDKEKPVAAFSLAGLNEMAQEWNLNEATSRERKSDSQLLADVENKVNEWIADGTYGKNIEELISKGEQAKPLSDEENLIMSQHLATLRDSVSTLSKEHGFNSIEYKTASEAYQRARNASEMARQATGAALRIPTVKLEPLKFIEDAIIERKESLGVDVLTEAQIKQLQDIIDDYKVKDATYEQKLQEANDEITKLKAELETKTARQQRGALNIKNREQIKKEIKSTWDSISEKIRKSRADTNIQILPFAKQLVAIAPDVAKLVKLYSADLSIKLTDVIDNIYTKLQEFIPNISKKDVNDVIAGKYNEKKSTINELNQKLKDLKEEARLIAKLESLQNGEEPKTERGKVVRNQQITDLRNQIKDFRKEKGRTPDEILEAIKKRNETAKATIEKKIADKDFVTKRAVALDENAALRKANPKLWKEAMDAKIAKEEAADKYARMKQEDELAKMSKTQNVASFLVKTVATSRAIKAGIDDSITFVQLGMAILANPKMGAIAKWRALNAINNKVFKRQLAAFHSDPRWDIVSKSGLDITEPKSIDKAKQEELFANNMLDTEFNIKGKKINFWTNTGGIFERLFTSMGNNMRWLMFTEQIAQLEADGKTFETHPQDFKNVARVVNELTGRGKLNSVVQSANAFVSPIIWSPKMIASSLNLLGVGDIFYNTFGRLDKGGSHSGMYQNLTPKARRYALTQMGKGIGMGILIGASLALAGWDWDDDPFSDDFGAVISPDGQTTYNVYGRYAGTVKTLFQFFGGRKASRFGTDEDASEGRVIGKYLRGKMTPFAGFAYDYKFNDKKNFFTRQPIIGETMGEQGKIFYKNLIEPISISALQKGLEQDGTMGIFTRFVPEFEGIQIKDVRDFGGAAGHLSKEASDYLKSNGVDVKAENLSNPFEIKNYNDYTKRKSTPQEMKEYVELKAKLLSEKIQEIPTMDVNFNLFGDMTLSENEEISKTIKGADLTKEQLQKLVSKLASQSSTEAKKELFIDYNSN